MNLGWKTEKLKGPAGLHYEYPNLHLAQEESLPPQVSNHQEGDVTDCGQISPSHLIKTLQKEQ